MNLQELTTKINQKVNLNGTITPFDPSYTTEDIKLSNYIYINPDDLNFQLGYEANIDTREDLADYHHGFIEDLNQNIHLDIYIY